MRLLQRLEVWPQQSEHLGWAIDLPKLALIVKWFLAAPELEDDLERFAGHLAVLPAHAVDVEHRPIARQPARRSTPRRSRARRPSAGPADPTSGRRAGSAPADGTAS